MPDQERFQKICKILGDSTIEPGEGLRRIAAMVSAASQYRYVGEPGLQIEPMIGVARRLCRERFVQGGVTGCPEAPLPPVERFSASWLTSGCRSAPNRRP